VGTYAHHKQEHLIDLVGGGSIYYFGLDDPAKVGSLNLGAVGIDEAVEIDEDDYLMLLGRLRNHADPCRQVFGACNPGAPTHFLYKRFFEEQNPKREVISTTSAENVFLPHDYQSSLDEFTGQSKERYVEGKWVAFEGLVYDQWDPAVFVTDAVFVPETVVIGVDYGFVNPTALVAIGVNGAGYVRVVEEVYGSQMGRDGILAHGKAMMERHKADMFLVDPSAPELIEAMNVADLPTEAAVNRVDTGLQTVGSYLRVSGEGKPLLTVDPACKHLIREFSAYRWKDKAQKEQPIKEADHALDALRYGMMYVDRYLNASATAVALDPKAERVEPGEYAIRKQDMGIEDDDLSGLEEITDEELKDAAIWEC